MKKQTKRSTKERIKDIVKWKENNRKGWEIIEKMANSSSNKIKT